MSVFSFNISFHLVAIVVQFKQTFPYKQQQKQKKKKNKVELQINRVVVHPINT